MKSETFLFGRILKKYKMSKKDINDLNKTYEKARDNLNSFGPRLAGRLETELDFTKIFESTKIFPKICKCIIDYVNEYESLITGSISNSGEYEPFPHKSFEIISCWINDMKEGEYNPPHTHHDNSGWSTVLFLKVPKFIDDTKDPHKFKDGQLGFRGHSSTTAWFKPEVGDFYVFEASHVHSVNPFKTNPPNQIRRSMSFNFVLKHPNVK
jgi:hypothetical protein|tara:strand:+ start:694 stop:1323 length:630 start_codon:yes stop_codon:yes gene_type:complete